MAIAVCGMYVEVGLVGQLVVCCVCDSMNECKSLRIEIRVVRTRRAVPTDIWSSRLKVSL
jgi:hypothetical protein